jgi:hypothetical protein
MKYEFGVLLCNAPSECQPKCQLNLAIESGRIGDSSYVPRAHSRSGKTKLGMIERIEKFRAKREFLLFSQPKMLRQG